MGKLMWLIDFFFLYFHQIY